jgi:hypothetical protein
MRRSSGSEWHTPARHVLHQQKARGDLNEVDHTPCCVLVFHLRLSWSEAETGLPKKREVFSIGHIQCKSRELGRGVLAGQWPNRSVALVAHSASHAARTDFRMSTELQGWHQRRRQDGSPSFRRSESSLDEPVQRSALLARPSTMVHSGTVSCVKAVRSPDVAKGM